MIRYKTVNVNSECSVLRLKVGNHREANTSTGHCPLCCYNFLGSGVARGHLEPGAHCLFKHCHRTTEDGLMSLFHGLVTAASDRP